MQFVLYSRGRGLRPTERRALDRRWEIERAAGQACSADRRVHPPARQAMRIAPQRFGVHELEQRVRDLARHPRLRYLPASRLRHRFLDLRVLSYGYRRYLRPE
jgi:hypothetical protein